MVSFQNCVRLLHHQFKMAIVHNILWYVNSLNSGSREVVIHEKIISRLTTYSLLRGAGDLFRTLESSLSIYKKIKLQELGLNSFCVILTISYYFIKWIHSLLMKDKNVVNNIFQHYLSLYNTNSNPYTFLLIHYNPRNGLLFSWSAQVVLVAIQKWFVK